MAILLLINFYSINENEYNSIKSENNDKIYKNNLMKKEDFFKF